ncbi:MAG TPA: cupredoxin family copper-binding protein [Solirubrobacterales bacterium]|jgi:plastocyanin|nr:cupredoxin family copper-binding protein [Solirubrobacterales bacterium]
MKARASLAAVLIALVALGLSACGGSGDDSSSTGASTAVTDSGAATGANAPAPSGEAERSAKVEIVDFAYDPDPVRVQVGGKVIWLNQDSDAHTATAEDGSFDTGSLAEGKLKSETFKQAGAYAYVCSFHPTMHGTVEVVEKG